MPLPASWVDALFAKLSLRYGAAFMRQWPDAEPALIKADWADVLNGYDSPDRRNAITFAMDSLPPDRPPNALQFLSLCRGYSGPERQPRIENNATADIGRVKELVGKLKKPPPMHETNYARECMKNNERVTNGGKMSAAQKHVYESCKRMVEGRMQEGAK